MSNDRDEGFTVIPAPEGTKGIFDRPSDDKASNRLEIDAVAFLSVPHSIVSRSEGAPVAYSVSGERAKAIILSGNRVRSNGKVFVSVDAFVAECDTQKQTLIFDAETGLQLGRGRVT